MTNSIQIQVTGTEFEVVTLNLTSQEVTNLYENSKSLKEEIKNLTKSLESEKNSVKYYNERNSVLANEIEQANTLLTALGVQVQNNEEESYRKANLPIATRIALYIATNK